MTVADRVALSMSAISPSTLPGPSEVTAVSPPPGSAVTTSAEPDSRMNALSAAWPCRTRHSPAANVTGRKMPRKASRSFASIPEKSGTVLMKFPSDMRPRGPAAAAAFP